MGCTVDREVKIENDILRRKDTDVRMREGHRQGRW